MDKAPAQRGTDTEEEGAGPSTWGREPGRQGAVHWQQYSPTRPRVPPCGLRSGPCTSGSGLEAWTDSGG